MKLSKTALSTLSAAVLGFLALGVASTPASASTATATFLVNATVSAYCTVAATPMAFGAYTAAAATASTSTVTVTCSNGWSYTLGLNAGLGTLATVTNRSMTAAGVSLDYGLFTDSGHTTNFATLASATGTGLPVATTVYGQVPAGQYVAAGTYQDTITATVTY